MIVVGLGTSLIARGGWLAPLGTMLTQRLGRPVQTMNLGGAGRTSAWGVQMAQRAAAPRPDVVLVEFSINDADIRNLMSFRESYDNAREIVKRIRSSSPRTKIYLMTMNPALGLKAAVRPFLPSYYQTWRDAAHSANVQLIDIYPRWVALGPERLRTLIPDGTHPTEAAGRYIILPPLVAALS